MIGCWDECDLITEYVTRWLSILYTNVLITNSLHQSLSKLLQNFKQLIR